MMNLEVGKSLWWVGGIGHQKQQREVSVIKVGRVWATLSNGYRIDLLNWCADGGSYISPGRCFESKESYELSVAEKMRWEKFRKRIESTCHKPKTCSLNDLAAAEALIFGLPPTEGGEQ